MKRFVYFPLFILGCILFFQACGIDIHSNSIKGNGNIITNEITISDYEKIELRVGMDIVYEQQPEKPPYLQLNIDENILPLVDIRVENERLIVKTSDNQNISPTLFKVYTNSKNLASIDLTGSGEIRLKGKINIPSLAITLSGSGDIFSDSLYCGKFSLNGSGSGDLYLKGECTDCSLNMSGSCDIKAFDFLVQKLSCKISGSADVEVTVQDALNVVISGSGDLKYKGNPKTVNNNISGSGNIKRVE